MNDTLLNFEKQLSLGPTYAARLLGVAYPTYAAYRAGTRELPLYIERSISVHLQWKQDCAGDAQRESNFQEYTHGKSRRS